MSLYVVSEEQVDELWPLLSPFLESSLYVGDEFTIDDLHKEVKSKQGLLWMGFSDNHGVYGAAITEIIQYPKKKVFLIKYLGAKPGAMAHLLGTAMETFRKLAVEWECDVVQLYGRKGWVNVLKPFGYKPIKYVCELDLKG
jgi:hypothetical protein